jgi:hypothetical protein
MLTHTAFHKLPREEQYNYIWGKCLYLATRQETALKINLYYSGSFFIEVEYYVHNGRVRLIRTFHSSDRLALYVNDVVLHDLLPAPSKIRPKWYRFFQKLPKWFWAGIVIELLMGIAICHYWLKLF